MSITRLGLMKTLASIRRPAIPAEPLLLSFLQLRWNSTLRLPPLHEQNDPYLRKSGIPGLFSPVGFQYGWLDYQSHIIKGFSERYAEVTSDRLYDESVVDIPSLEVIMERFARHAKHAALFNYASMAYNNEFFFRGIKHDLISENETTVMPASIQKCLEIYFGSVENFKSEFLANANAIFGGGFVWLVSHRIRPDERDSYTAGTYHRGISMQETAYTLKILRTYNAGSPLSGSHWRSQSTDLREQNMYDYVHKQSLLAKSASSESYLPAEKERRIRNLAEELANDDFLSRTSDAISTNATATEIKPILCASVWEHSYIIDWRIKNRRQYLEAWWDRVNWNRLLKYSPFDEF